MSKTSNGSDSSARGFAEVAERKSNLLTPTPEIWQAGVSIIS